MKLYLKYDRHHIIISIQKRKKQKMQTQKISIKDFTNLIQIGHGAFGKVYRAVYIKNKRTFALKRMQISHLQKQNMISQINTEIEISMSLKHQNIIKVYDCFQDQNYIYMVLQLAENGQLYEKLRRVGRFDQNAAKTMIKEVIAAVQFLHSRNPPIVHRDIKPQNLLLDKNFRIKLADFGWSTILNKPRKTYCGTVDYLAPQMIDKSGHDEKLDIWCIGVLVYELLTGRTPFLGANDGTTKNSQALYDNILNVRIEFPEDFPTLAKDFVLGMIKRNPKERMSFPQIKSHPWLQEKVESTIKFSKQIASSNGIKPEQKIQKLEPESNSSQIIKTLNQKIRQLQQQNLSYKLKIEQLEGKRQNGSPSTTESNQMTKLMNEVRRLKVTEEMNEKYKKKQQKMWDEINEKEKQIIKMKTDLKRVEDLKSELERVENDKDKLIDKTKRLQKQLQISEQKNRQLQSKLQQANSSFTQRIKNGQKINKQEIQSAQFLTFLRDQISDLTEKFEESKDIVSKMLQKQNIEKKSNEQLSKLKAQQKKLKENIKSELKEKYQNQKDDLLTKIRNQLTEQKEKWYKQREQLRVLYEQSNGTNTEASSNRNTKFEDLEGQLKNVRELNSYYEKTVNKQKYEIEDLKEQLKRKK